MRNRKMIAEWCYERGKADNVIEWVEQDGKRYIVVNDFERLRSLFGEMLREVQRIKSTGDYEAGRALVEKYAVKIDPELHREVLERYARLGIEPYSGFVNPDYEPREGRWRDRRCETRSEDRLHGADARLFDELLVPAVDELTSARRQ